LAARPTNRPDAEGPVAIVATEAVRADRRYQQVGEAIVVNVGDRCTIAPDALAGTSAGRYAIKAVIAAAEKHMAAAGRPVRKAGNRCANRVGTRTLETIHQEHVEVTIAVVVQPGTTGATDLRDVRSCGSAVVVREGDPSVIPHPVQAHFLSV
jgi:hypothetical protein